MLNASTVAVLGTLLIACGGGSSTAETATPVTPPAVTPPAVTPPAVTPPSPALTLSSVQGFWDAVSGDAIRMNAVILPNGQMWVVQETAGLITGLAQVNLNLDGTTFSNTGRYYPMPNGAVQEYRFSGSLPTGPRASLLTTIGIGSGAATTTTWRYNSTYETSVNAREVQARWSGSLGAVNVLWDVDAAGKLAGTSTAGCTYSGTLAPNPGAPAVLEAAIAESCGSTLQSLNGMARLGTDKTSLSVVYTTAAGARSGAIILRK
jgi:hypothetical protein